MNETWFMGSASHKGAVKEKNEDSSLHLSTSDGKGAEIALFVVADGMGGYDIGETASRHAINEVKNWWNRRILKIIKRRDPLERMMKEGERLILQINKSLHALAKEMDKKMGTTLSLLILYKGSYVVLHIGDSRIYLLRNWEQMGGDVANFYAKQGGYGSEQPTLLLSHEPELLQITEDHSWVAKQIEKGLMDEEDARNHPNRNVLTQCLGIEDKVVPYVQKGNYASHDLFLVCSDGFYSLYSNEEIKNMLLGLEKEYGDLQAVTDYLINFSNFAEARDNVTLMLIRHGFQLEEELDDNRFISFLKGRTS